MIIRIHPEHDALVIVDPQNDFCPGGSLAVPGGDKIMPVVNRLMPKFDVVVATKDWHPKGHHSFASTHGVPPFSIVQEAIVWPDHCVQGTRGAEFHQGLHSHFIQHTFYKGWDIERDEFSGLVGRLGCGAASVLDGTHYITLDGYLRGTRKLLGAKAPAVTRVFITGLATDYCVKATVLDALKLGYETYVVTDAIAAVNAKPEDGEAALREMLDAGAKFCTSREIYRTPRKRHTI